MKVVSCTVYNMMKMSIDKLHDENIVRIFIASIITFVITIIYLRRRNKFTYWKKKNIPTPPVSLLWGNLNDMVKAPTLKFKDWINQYGQIVGIYLGTQPALIVADAEMLQEILITNFTHFSDRRAGSGLAISNSNLISQNGIQWKHDRSIISPTFTSSKMKQMYPLIKDSIKCLDNEFNKLATNDEEVDCKLVFSKLTAMVICRCAFATHVDAFNDSDNEVLIMLHRFFKISSLRTFMRFFLSDSIKKLVGFSSVDPKALDYIGKLCGEIIKQRSQCNNFNGKYRDLLQLLMDAQAEATAKNNDNSFSQVKVISNVILFLIAGFETTSTLLKWTSYALAVNPIVQEKLYQEVKEAIETHGHLDYDIIFDLKYLDALIHESLRMYSPVVRVERVATTQHTFRNGLTIDKGTSILIPIHTIQHLSQYYIDVETFRPERFMSPEKEKIISCSYLPFLQGPRNCVGARFALLEAKVTLATLCLKYKFVAFEKTPLHDQLLFNLDVNTLEVQSIPLKIHKRLQV